MSNSLDDIISVFEHKLDIIIGDWVMTKKQEKDKDKKIIMSYAIDNFLFLKVEFQKLKDK